MKFATELIDAASPCISIELPLRFSDVSQTIIHVHHCVGDHLQQVLAAGPISLQRLDHVDALLQNGLLAFEAVHVLLDLLEARSFGSQRGDLGVRPDPARFSAGSR